MTKYQTYLQNGLEKLKQRASQVLSSREEVDEERLIELEENIYEQLKQLASDRRITVQEVLHQVLEQHFFEDSEESLRYISEEQKERNPLLRLDGICQKQFRGQEHA